MAHVTPHSRVRAASAWCGHDGEGVVEGMSEVMLREHEDRKNELDGMSGSGADVLVGAVPSEVEGDEDVRYERDSGIRGEQARSSIE